MSIKKELLNKLSEDQLKKLAEFKGIDFTLDSLQEKYYKDWDEKDKLVDLMNDDEMLTVSDIEKFIVYGKV
jgi:hypothetical protein